MAALVVRSSDHDSALLAGLGHHGSAHFQADKVASRIARNEDSSSSLHGGRSRSRKNKNGPKKQPQRGLGVAQLEKLRLQEQSKQDAACLASFGLVPLPSGYGFEQEVCLPHPLLSRHHHHHLKEILSLGSGYRNSPSASDRNGGFASSDPPLASDPSLAILMQQHEMAAAIHGSRMVAGATSKSPPGSSPAPRIVLPDHHPVEKNANVAAMVAMRVCSTASRTEEMMMKQHQQQQQQDVGKAHKSGDASGHHLGVNCVQLFDASLPPGSLPMRDCRELSMVGIPKELSSFQTKFPGNQVWPSMHNASVEKRPCVVISLDHGEILPNTPTAQSEIADNILKSAHYTPRSISTALGKSSLPFLKPDTSPGFETKAKLDHYHATDDNSTSSVSSMPFLRKRAACYLDSPAKKPAGAAAADFLALSLSIAHSSSSSSDIESSSSRSRICAARCGDDTRATPAPQRSSLSLQEALTDVEDGSSARQTSPSSHGGGNSSAEDASTIEVDASVVVASRHRRHHTGCGSGIGIGIGIQDVDLSLKLAI